MAPSIQGVRRCGSDPGLYLYLCQDSISPSAGTSAKSSWCTVNPAATEEEKKLIMEENKYNEEAPKQQNESWIDHKPKHSEEQFQLPDTIKFPRLELTKMKWLSEVTGGKSSPLSSRSLTSTAVELELVPADRCLATVLQLDREQHMFGLSALLESVHTDLVLRKGSESNNPPFFQTTIVQRCCASTRCRHMSNSDLPCSLKCGGCRSCCAPCPAPARPCYPPIVPPCISPCISPTIEPCVPSVCSIICPREKCCKKPCRASRCALDCAKIYGMKITLNRKPKVEPPLIEITPRVSCALAKPLSARPCPHCPPCTPPSSCFPYLMPCYWPSRPSAPCTQPTRCFHHPPCQPPRKRRPCDHKKSASGDKCEAKARKSCNNQSCPRMKNKSPAQQKSA